ncbi:membrane associated adenyl cyclase with 2 transmembrane regions and an adenylyl cyclase domain [Cryptosporidium sp. chipmunk genotype I]|uniref:membrane associated adenyl cyclase with 2 transmembrane regions and an adenylyl cyclase domain n=1 Tax=Cryptosporidium sp. chipmunk genotype I TaxID=1280935 RepID=UPI00351A65B0|nr:membrane associated adenyl cyclase with 2 transmembrane regions and an adenylyl cyclase domain [Cryptosporidium sp. chipmunk genotype I]
MQTNHSDYRNKFYSNNLNSIFTNLLGNNVEALIRTGAKLDFFVFTQNSNRKESYLKKSNSNFNKLSSRKEIDFLYSPKNILNSIKFSSVYQDFDFLELTCINKNQHFIKEQKCVRPVTNTKAHRNEILPLFDLLISHVNRLQLSNFQNSKRSDTCLNENPSSGIDTNSIDKYIIHDINNFLGFKKQAHLFSNCGDNKLLIFPVKLLNKFYEICSKSLIEISIQILHIMNINILRSKYVFYNIYLSEIIIIVLSLITVCLDIFFYLFNWRSIPKIGMAIEIIHLIFITLYFCDSKNLIKEFFNIYGCLLYYSYIYRIIFILQCKFTNRYNKFQVTEIVRTQLKQIFYSTENDISLMISSSKFENICIKLGIDIFYQNYLLKQSLYTYLFQNFDWIPNKLFGPKHEIPTSSIKKRKFATNFNCNHRFMLIINKLYSNFKLVYIKLCLLFKLQSLSIFRYFLMCLKLDYSRLLKLFPKEIISFKHLLKKTNSTTYQEYILNKKQITYEEFEMLLISLDCKKKLLTRIDTHTSLFEMINGSCLLLHRKIIFEQSFYNITLFIFLTLTVIYTIEAIFNSYGNKLSQINNTTSITQAYYFLVIFISSIFHFKVDNMYYNSSLKSYNRIINKYNLIYGNLQLVGKNQTSSNKDHFNNNLSRNDYLLDFLSYHSAESLEKYVNTFSKYLPQGVAMSLLKKFNFSTLNPQYKEITILFSDIVGFTSIAESVSPFLLFRLLTNYFDEMVKIIEEFHGNLLEIAGDAILVIWNSPVTVKNHSAAAVAASLKMKKELKLKSISLGNNYFPEINIKCGIHTDRVLVGNIGCNKRMKYGIMGDGVNLASRIESLTKRYSVDIIISNSVFANKKVQKKFVICPLDVVIVQGKSSPTVIYHVLNTVNDSDPVSLLKSKFHTKALIFFINKDFKRSLFYIKKINELGPFKNDSSTITLSNKCRQFRNKKLDINWSCAEVLNTKYFNE